MHQRVNNRPLLTGKPSPQLPTPVKLVPLVKRLSGYDPDIVKFLISGFSNGSPLNFQGIRQNLDSKNLSPAIQNQQAVDMKLAQELAANRLAGPFATQPFQTFCVSDPKKSAR